MSKSRLEVIQGYLTQDLWETDLLQTKRLKRWGLRFLRILVLLGERLLSRRSVLRASALTYKTMLSLVPFLAFAFSVAKGLGAQEMLAPLFIENLAVGQEEVGKQLLEYISRTDVKALGGVGLAFLLLTVISLIGSAESALNEIWGVARARSLARKFADYLSVTIIFPILLLATTGLTASLSSQETVQRILATVHLKELVSMLLALAPFFTVSLAFTFLYLFLPNTKVRFLPALIGGVVGGSAWLMAQWLYIDFQVGVARYNAIYGTFAALPVFLVWLYLSWVIVLVGAELANVLQVHQGEAIERRSGELSLRDQKRVALRLVMLEARRMDAGEPPLGESQFIEQVGGLPARQVRSVLDSLARGGVLQFAELENGEPSYLLRRSPDRLTVVDVLEAIERKGDGTLQLEESWADTVIEGFEQMLREDPENCALRKALEHPPDTKST